MSIRRVCAALICCVPLMGATSVSATAATVAGFNTVNSCSINDVSTATACIGTVINSGDQFTRKRRDNVAKVNANGFFGFNDWAMIDRINTRNQRSQGSSLNGTFNRTTSGTFGISATRPFTEFMLVLKSRRGYAAYLLGGTGGTWTTNALMSFNGNQQNLRLVSLYARPGAAALISTPIPAGGLLLTTGLLGLAFAARTRRRQHFS